MHSESAVRLHYDWRRCNRSRTSALITTAAFLAISTAFAHAAPRRVRIALRAIHQSYHNAPVTLDIAASKLPFDLKATAFLLTSGRKERLACQISPDGEIVHLAFLLP